MIKALPGCVIYFPTRQLAKDEPVIVYGHIRTRRRWREEWVQLLIDLVEIDVRLEGDNTFNLGDDLRCDVVAKLQAQVDDSKLHESLPKVVSSFLCSTTSDPKAKLAADFFKQKLQRMFRSVVEEVARKASYLELLENPSHHTYLSSEFEAQLKTVLHECGFKIVSQWVRFRPLDPGSVGRRPDIAKKWMEWGLAQERLDADKEYAHTELVEENKRRLLLSRAETAKKERAFNLQEQEAQKDYARTLQECEVAIAQINKEKEFRLAEIRKELDDYFNSRQQQDIIFKHELRVSELRNQEKEKEIAEEEERARQRRRMEDEEDARARRLKTLSDEKTVEDSELQIAKIVCEKLNLKDSTEAQRVEAMTRAERTVELEKLKEQGEIVKTLFAQLPEIFKNMPVQTVGETTLISIGKDSGISEGQLGLGVFGLAALPFLKQLLDLVPERLKVPGNMGALHKEGEQHPSSDSSTRVQSD